MKCKHEKCKCSDGELRPDGYCSDACQQEQETLHGRCACGHPHCS